MTTIIYRAYNNISEKSYIGQTIKGLECRKYQHFYYARRAKELGTTQSHFYRALNKYQQEDWEWSVVEECDESELDERERYFIDKFDSFNNGYNSTDGGECGKKDLDIYKLYNGRDVLEGTRHELKELIMDNYSGLDKLLTGAQDSALGWILYDRKEEFDSIMSYYTFEHKDGRIERKHRSEWIEIGVCPNSIVKGGSSRGWKMIGSSPKRRGDDLKVSVQQLDANGVLIATFKGLNEASRATGVHKVSISNSANGKTKKGLGKGFIWRWA